MPSTVQRLFREPLVHFAIGALVVTALGRHRPTARPVLVVPAAVVDDLTRELRARSSGEPSDAEVQRRIDHFVDEEVLFREGLARGLGAGDAVARQRVVQRMTFVLQGERRDPQPGDGALRAYEEAHADRYAVVPRYSFEHVYFASRTRGDAARSDAERALAALRTGSDPAALGDRFPSGGAVRSRPLVTIGAEFGSAFADPLATAPIGAWVGPVPSTYGWHLVRLTDRTRPGLLPLDAVRAPLLADYLADRASTLDRASLAPLRARYDVRVEHH